MLIHGNELSERKKIILKAIVDAHIDNGEPVGSKYLARNKQIALSSATIRNEMAELEEMGYLEQPHTSAGRVPSQLGYRFYVGRLMEGYHLTAGELKELGGLVSSKAAQLDRIMEHAAKLMTMFTNYTSLVAMPKPSKVVVWRYKTILLDSANFLLVMMTNADIIKTRRIRTSGYPPLTEEALSSFETALNVYLTAVPMESITLPLIMDMESRLRGSCDGIVTSVIKCIYDAISELEMGDIKLEGMNKLLEYPEYADIERLRSLLSLLDNKEDILNIISNSERDATNIYIGSENTVDIMQKSTLIFKTINSGENVVGAIGVIGPCRMDYSRVITAVEHITQNIINVWKNKNIPAEISGELNAGAEEG